MRTMDAPTARMNQWDEISIKINRLEERISVKADTEKEGLKVILAERERRGLANSSARSGRSKV